MRRILTAVTLTRARALVTPTSDAGDEREIVFVSSPSGKNASMRPRVCVRVCKYHTHTRAHTATAFIATRRSGAYVGESEHTLLYCASCVMMVGASPCRVIGNRAAIGGGVYVCMRPANPALSGVWSCACCVAISRTPLRLGALLGALWVHACFPECCTRAARARVQRAINMCE